MKGRSNGHINIAIYKAPPPPLKTMEIKINRLRVKEEDNNINITLSVPKKNVSESALESISFLYYSGIPLTANIEPQHQNKSLSANNYAWSLITEIAKVITSTKEEVYRQLIKDYGVCAVVSVKTENFEVVANEWAQNGLGYMVEIIDSDNENTNAFFYKGIHSYSNEEMRNFLNGVISEAQALEIETRTPEEIRKAEENWRNQL